MREIKEVEGSEAYILVEGRGKELSVSWDNIQRRKEVEMLGFSKHV